jgi:O-antigen ligase
LSATKTDARNIALFSILPLLVAYGLQGAKNPFGFFMVFLCVAALFHGQVLKPNRLHLPATLFIPFGLYFMWLWLSVTHDPPLDIFLFSIARVFLYFMFALLVFFIGTASAIGRMVLGFGLIESICICLNYSRLKLVSLEQFGGILANPLHSGILIPVAVCVAFSELREHQHKASKAILAASLCLLNYSTFLLRARAAMLAIGLVALMAAPQRIRKKVFIAGLIGLLALAFFARQKILAYLEIDPYGMLSTIGRFSIWKTDLLAIAAHPLSGYGLGNFEFAFMQFHSPSSEFLHYAKSTIFAHNGMLQTCVDAGIPALLFLLCGFGSISVLVYRTRNIGAPLSTQWYFWGILVYFLTSLFNYSLFLPFNGLVFAACIGLLLQRAHIGSAGIALHQFGRLLQGLMIFFTLFLLALGVSDLFSQRKRFDVAARLMPIKSEYWYSLALSELTGNPPTPDRYRRSLVFLKKAALWNSHDPFVWSRIAKVLNVADHENDIQISTAFGKAETIAPKHAPFWVEHAFYSLSLERWEDARSRFQRAANLEPSTPLPFYGLGLVALHDAHFSEAKQLFEFAKSMKEKQPQVEAVSSYNKELLETPYGQYLYSVDLNLLDRLIFQCQSKLTPPRPHLAR